MSSPSISQPEGSQPAQPFDLRDYVSNAQSSYCDPFSAARQVVKVLVGVLTIPAITLLVFYRHRIGYRLPKPLMLSFATALLLVIVLAVNVLAFGAHLISNFWHFNPIAQQARQAISTATAEKPAAASSGPFAGNVLVTPAGKRIYAYNTGGQQYYFDTQLPPTFNDFTAGQQGAWMRQHRINRPPDARPLDQTTGAAAAPAVPAPPTSTPGRFWPHISLLVFTLVFLALGIRKRREGRELLRERWHTMSRGQSYLADALPQLTEYRIQAYVEPALTFIVGCFIAWLLSISLGLWLMFAALCLWLSEVMLMDLLVNEALDKFDIEAEGRYYTQLRKTVKEAAVKSRVKDNGGIRGAAFDPETMAALKAAGAA